jgi:uncharacterized membrane protein AbrB (regulator of aidB expression)
MNYVHSLVSVAPRLKGFWLLGILIGLAVVAFSIRAENPSFFRQFSIFVSGALIGFACNAFFACKDQFLLRAL